MQLTSAAFQAGAEIPSYYTGDGDDVSPELSWKNAPPETKSFVLVMHDPDTPRRGGFTHWVVYNISPETGHIEEKVPPEPTIAGLGVQGRNDAGALGYMGPAPGSGVHRYFFRLFALDDILDLEPGATHSQVSAKMKGHILAQAELMGTYEKKTTRVA
jgi:Raf kinase inhibitor-like YbhB/YbcL family protein